MKPRVRFATIGAHGFTPATFLAALAGAQIDLLVDVRRRRGMRGSQYAFWNSLRLQAALRDAGIGYAHELALAPPLALRAVQTAADARAGIGSRSREQLAPEYVRRYRRDVLAPFDAPAFELSLDGARAVALFCVERQPAACHRALAAEHLARVLASTAPVLNLVPPQ